jgi:hypothetical protein
MSVFGRVIRSEIVILKTIGNGLSRSVWNDCSAKGSNSAILSCNDDLRVFNKSIHPIQNPQLLAI